ncbi:DUF1634 domain-containing protein [Mucilaginibacter sp.]
MKKILSKSYWVDQDIEQMIGQLLRYGVVISSAIVLIGGLDYLYQYGGNSVPAYGVFNGESVKYTTFGGIIKSVMALNTKGIVQLGVMALIATPVLRIAFSLFAFFVEKDKLYIVITFIVLSVMLISIFGGFKG